MSRSNALTSPRLGVCLLVAALPGCGGRSYDTSSGTGGSGGTPAHLTLDDVDREQVGYPSIPEGSAAFYWPAEAPHAIGNWFVYSADENFGDAEIEWLVPERGQSKKAIHVSGAGHARGVDLWAQLWHPDGFPMDLSQFSGIGFWARLTSASGRLVVAINDGSGYFHAEDVMKPLASKAFSATDQWQSFDLTFSDIGANPADVVSIDFVAGDDAEEFELWIDDVRLNCRSDCP